jgi:hypothetical protein
LSYPTATHSNAESLKSVLQLVGPKKSVLLWAEREQRAGRSAADPGLQAANTVVNNAIDLEFYKAFTANPMIAGELVKSPYFESIGHSYRIAYSHAVNVIAGTVDPDFNHIPGGEGWDRAFEGLAAEQHEGYYYGSPVRVGPVGIRAIFEGQARFIQLQYLTAAINRSISCEKLKEAGYFSGVYGEAFESFLSLAQAEWPQRIDDPLVALFLLICDVSINPAAGFPNEIASFQNFVTDVDPGIRFGRLSRAVGEAHPELRTAITDYSRTDYIDVASRLAAACGYASPLHPLRTVVEWVTAVPGIAKVLSEKETFKYEPANLPVRVLLSHFVAFCADKLAHPEFFYWAGARMAGHRVSPNAERLFLSHLSLYSDRADDDGVFPRDFPGKDRDGVLNTLNVFYANNVVFDLTRQWILQAGPFRFDYRWLSQRHTPEEMEVAAKGLFERTYGVAPDAFEILS